jgi:PEP-CTERM motif
LIFVENGFNYSQEGNLNKTNSNPIQENKPMKNILKLIVGLIALGSGVTHAATTYVGNGSTAWGGTVGNGSLVVNDLADGTLTFTVTAGSGFGGNTFVLFIDSKSGGFNTTANFTDTGDPLRKAISGFNGGTDRSTTLLGINADYAIAADSGYGGLWELTTASHIHQLGVGSLGADPVTSKVLTLNVSNLGLTANSGQSFNFFGMLISGTGYSSSEFLGVTSVSGSLGYGNTQTVSGSSTYTLIPEPSSSLLMGLGLAGLAVLRRTRKNA